jgi:hypothetical protein
MIEMNLNAPCVEARLQLQEAKARVYKVEQPPPQVGVPTGNAELKPVLDEQPKWVLLQQIACEIQMQRGLLASRAVCQPNCSVSHATTAGRSCTGATSQAVNYAHVSDSIPMVSAKESLDEKCHGQPHDRTGCKLLHAQDGREYAGQYHDRDRIASKGSHLCAQQGSPMTPSTAPEACWAATEVSGVRAHSIMKVDDDDDDDDDDDVVGTEHAWMLQLSGDMAQACAKAPVLIVVKERHLVSELRSVLAVRTSSSFSALHADAI